MTRHPKTRERHHVTNGRFLERLQEDRRDNKLAVFLELFAIAVIATVMLIPVFLFFFR